MQSSTCSSTVKKTAASKALEDSDQLRGLRDVIVCALIMLSLFATPGVLSLFEAIQPDYEKGEVRDPQLGKIRRQAWPLLKDPDSMLSIQAMLRCLMLALFLSKLSQNGCRWESIFGAMRSRVLAGAAAWMFLASYAVRVYLFQFPWFRLEGPIGGRVSFAFDCLACVLLVALSLTWLRGRSFREMVPTCALVGAGLRLGYSVATENYMEIDPRAGSMGNIAFSFVFDSETLACCLALSALLTAPVGTSFCGGVRRPSVLLGLLMIAQQSLSLYWVLDSFEWAPQSTFDFAGPDNLEMVSLPGKGNPEQFMIAMVSLQYATVWLGILVSAFWPTSRWEGADSAKALLMDVAKDNEIFSV